MSTRKHFTFVLCLILTAGTAFTQTKRPLNHRDYDGWRTIGTPTLSRDGKFLAYGLFPEEGDGQVVVRNLTTNLEWREKAGERPQPAAPEPGAEEAVPQQRNVTISFTADRKWVVFSTFPNRVDVAQAKKDKKRPDEMPKGAMVIMSLDDGKTTRIANVKNFQVPTIGSGYFAYLKEATPAAVAGPPEGSTADSEEDQRGGRGGAGAGAGGRGRSTYGTDLILRNTSNGSEHTFADVSEYLLTRDAATLAYAVSSRKSETNGVYALPTSGTQPTALLAGKGKYSKITFDQKGYFVFVSNHDDADSKTPKWKLYGWDRRQPAAPVELVTAATPGLHAGYALSDRGALRFTRDGGRLVLAVAPPREEAAESDAPPAPAVPGAGASTNDDKVHADLWHWKDDHIQPIQKLRAAQERNRTYVAVLDVSAKKLVQLSTPEISTVTPSEQATWAFGVDDRAYRIMSDYDSGYGDLYLVDGSTGASKKLIEKNRGRPQWSPDGRFGIIFDGKDWNSISVPDGKLTNLTSKLGVAFWNEDNDTPEIPPAYGAGGFTSDGKWALLCDNYDVWQVAPDGSAAKNLTGGLGRREHLRLRAMNFPSEDDEGGPNGGNDRGFDPTQPMLLRAENLETRDTGYYRVAFGGAPEKLMMAAKNFGSAGGGRGGAGAGGTLIKARKANVVVVSAGTFAEFPNLHVTDLSFKQLRKVTDADPQQSQLLWGTSEMIHFKNSDGVPLEGALYKPENFDAKKKYPMLVYIYERLSQGLNNFVNPAPGHSINISYYVSNGYLVLTPDIVYTTGYPGQSALKCVLPAIQSVVDRGFVDEKAIGIQGHSWGGYQIAYMVTQTTRFRAAEAGAPVSDMISAYDGIRWGSGLPRQFQYEHTQSRIGGSIWEYPERFIQNSPIFQADRVQTPLMILSNDADDAVPWYQGIEYYLALRRLNKEVYMFVYNGEPHHIDRRPNQKDYTMRMQQFFDHYLKGAPEPDWMKNGIPYLDRDQEKERFNKVVDQP